MMPSIQQTLMFRFWKSALHPFSRRVKLFLLCGFCCIWILLRRMYPSARFFEATKVFEHGGPFADLLTCEPPKVHKDTRLRTSGELLRYSLEGNEYPTEPYMDSFFEWLYCRALKQFPEKAAQLSRYKWPFSDIAAAADSEKVLWRFLAGGCNLCRTCSGWENFRASIPMNHSLRKFTRSQSPCPSLENLRLLQKKAPEVSAPAKEIR